MIALAIDWVIEGASQALKDGVEGARSKVSIADM
jgi:hypothetical protein